MGRGQRKRRRARARVRSLLAQGINTITRAIRPSVPVHVIVAEAILSEQGGCSAMEETRHGISISAKDELRFRKLPLDEQYAILMALGDEDEYDARYFRALEDFRTLIGHPDLYGLGIHWEHGTLVAITAGVEAVDEGGINRKIGDIAITIFQNPAGYKVTNLSDPMRQGDEVSALVAHPHAFQDREFCMVNGNDRVRKLIADGACAEAVRILLTAAWMRPGETTSGIAYKKLCEWQEKEEP